MKPFYRLLALTLLHGMIVRGEFEDVSTICDRCTCVVANRTAGVLSYDLLDCSRRNLHAMIIGWPERFDTGNPDRELVLSLSGNDITTLQQLPATKMMLVFSCRHCGLTALDDGLFLDTPNIIRVDLSWNGLAGESLTADVFRGQYDEEANRRPLTLDELDLGSNVITHLADDVFQHVVSLRHLSLARNPLAKVGDTTARALAQLVNLETLDLSYASLTEIDDVAFGGMHALRELYLQGNELTGVPMAVFHLTTSLLTLHLGENPIAILDIGQPLDQLQHLNVSSMPLLHSIEVATFGNVKSLRTFTGRNNSALEVFDLLILQHVAGLEELDLSQSNLKHLSTPDVTAVTTAPDPERYANRLELLLLRENPWHCDCELQRVLRLINYGQLEDTEEETRCETPYMLTSLHLSDLMHIEVCDQPANDGPYSSVYEKPAFLRPGAIFLTLLSVGIVVGLGVIIGLVIVCLKRRLKANGLAFTSPVRYTSVRESTTSAVYQT